MVAELSGTPCWGSPTVDPSVTENISDLLALFYKFILYFFIVLCCWQIATRQTLFVRVHFSAYFTKSSITFSLYFLSYKLGNTGKTWLKITKIRWFLLQALLAYRFFLIMYRPSDNLQQLFRSAFNKAPPPSFQKWFISCAWEKWSVINWRIQSYKLNNFSIWWDTILISW